MLSFILNCYPVVFARRVASAVRHVRRRRPPVGRGAAATGAVAAGKVIKLGGLVCVMMMLGGPVPYVAPGVINAPVVAPISDLYADSNISSGPISDLNGAILGGVDLTGINLSAGSMQFASIGYGGFGNTGDFGVVGNHGNNPVPVPGPDNTLVLYALGIAALWMVLRHKI